MNNNFYSHWGKKFMKDGFRFMKIVIGIGLSACFAVSLNLPTGLLFLGWVLVDSLYEKE